MKLKDFEMGVLSYCAKYVAPQLRTTGSKWLMYFGLGVAGLRSEVAFRQIAPTLAAVGVIDEEGNIDLDLLEKAGLEAFEKQPRVDILNCTFFRNDFVNFMRHLRGEPPLTEAR